MVILFLIFCGTSTLFSLVAIPIYIPTNSVGGLSFSTHSSAFVICRLSNDGHSARYRVVPHCSLICISLIINDVGHLFKWRTLLTATWAIVLRSFPTFLIWFHYHTKTWRKGGVNNRIEALNSTLNFQLASL